MSAVWSTKQQWMSLHLRFDRSVAAASPLAASHHCSDGVAVTGWSRMLEQMPQWGVCLSWEKFTPCECLSLHTTNWTQNWHIFEWSLALAARSHYKTACSGATRLPFPCPGLVNIVRCRCHTCHRIVSRFPPTRTVPSLHNPQRTCGDASPAARSLSAGLTESEMPLSSSAAGSSLSESDPHVESHSSTVLGSLKRQLPNRFPI